MGNSYQIQKFCGKFSVTKEQVRVWTRGQNPMELQDSIVLAFERRLNVSPLYGKQAVPHSYTK